MSDGVAIIGFGYSGFAKATRSRSYKELMFDAATRAYSDADVDVRKEVGSFVCCEEDLWEGNSIADEYVPDQIGAALRPTCTVTNDGLGGLATAYMQILSGLADVVVVEAHSKLSDVSSKEEVARFGFDPVFGRDVAEDPLFFAGLEMNRFLHESGNGRESCADVTSLNKANGLSNTRASYARKITPEEVLSSKVLAFPLTELEVSQPADACVVFVVSSARKARASGREPIWIKGIGWASSTPWIQSMDFGRAAYAKLSSDMAYKMAGWGRPKADIAEVDDAFAYKELQHLEAIGLCKEGSAGKLIETGRFSHDGDMPVNVSGGSLAVGHLIEASGLHRAMEACLQLRGEAGKMQVNGARTAVVQSWRALTSSGAVAVLGVE